MRYIQINTQNRPLCFSQQTAFCPQKAMFAEMFRLFNKIGD